MYRGSKLVAKGLAFWVSDKQNSALENSVRGRRAFTMHLHKSVPFTEKGRETHIKDEFEEMKHEFPFRTFRAGKRN